MFLSALLRLSSKIFPSSSVAMNKMSSTYFMIMMGFSIDRKAWSRRSSITKSARIGLNDDPIFSPFICLK